MSNKNKDLKNTDYYKSGDHKRNALLACNKGRIKQTENKSKRIEKYNLLPNLCKECKSYIEYNKRNNHFCTKSCAAKYNNKAKGPRSQKTKDKISASLAGRKQSREVIKKRQKTQKKNEKVLIFCRVCTQLVLVEYVRRYVKTCGNEDCLVYAKVNIRPYQNGSRKPVEYFNKYENKVVWLDSSWEVEIAEYLDKLNIKWIRPKFIKWNDSKGNTRRYFPDFYLPDFDLYLDPKNPYCLQKDAEKMLTISTIVNIIYGDKELIKKTISEYNTPTNNVSFC